MPIRLRAVKPMKNWALISHLWNSSLVWSSPGVSTERQSLFLAPYRSADRISDGGGVEGEHEGITVVERLLAELAADVDQGRIADGKLLTLVLALRLRRPDLFV